MGEEELKMELYEKGKNLVIEIPALEMDMKDIHVTIKDNFLKITGSKKTIKEAKKEGYYAKEEKENSFLNEFTLPFKVQEGKAKTELKQGIFRIIVPKK